MEKHSLEQTAQIAVSMYRADRFEEAVEKDKGFLRAASASGALGGAISEVLSAHREAVASLSTCIVERYRWVQQHSLLPSRVSEKRWISFAEQESNKLASMLQAHTKSLLSKHQAFSGSAGVQLLRQEDYDAQNAKMTMFVKIREATQEVKKASYRWSLRLLDRILMIVVGAVIAGVAQLYFKR
ncbi:hypothetical protein [Luteibacter sp. ME-Dv--P-043b]|uniref:hypothetical protein n=1 Tax=Luteibacter sp. ME-Dv--P-043b TaxID=3040291 RepID=UPI0025535B37|nr:hypothetical protein [Luteibacter sp. ME-Dv--P-043b]